MGKYVEIGVHRFHCRDCGKRWSASKEEFFLLGYRGVREAHRCEGTDMRRARLQDGERRYSDRVVDWWGNTLEAEKVIVSTSIRHKRTSRPTECGDRCMGAQGADCDCKCGGENHGINA